jgi:hypothetical protein
MPDRWIHRGGKVFVVGHLHAVLRRGDGTLVGTADRQVTLPLRNGSVPGARLAPCDILNLVLGPLDLNLLGLHVTLNWVTSTSRRSPAQASYSAAFCAQWPVYWMGTHPSA